MDGIDVSEYQPADIGQVVPYDFLIAKATEGDSYVNPYHAQQVGDALNSGRRAALYHYARGRSVAAEVSAFCSAFDPYLGRAIPVLDWEGSALAAGAVWRQAWLDSASRSLGIRPLLYGSLSVVQGIPEALWTAAYGSNPVTYGYQNAASVGGVMRQYTSQGRLPGYGGALDLNKWYGTPADWDAHTGAAPAPKPQPKEASMFSFPQPVDGPGKGTIFIRNLLNGKEVGIQSLSHYEILVRYTQKATQAAEGLLQVEIDICEWYLNQIR